MEIKSTSNSVVITGNIKSIMDFQAIKTELDALSKTTKTITVDIKDSLSMTSSAIGYFTKLILKDGISINMKIGNAQLFELLTDLNLAGTFKATKV